MRGLGLGIPELFIVGFIVGPMVLFLILAVWRARKFGYEFVIDYLRAVPRSDAEIRDAVNLALQGVVLCAMGLLFAPFVLAGVGPMFYGGRKLAYVALGLNIVDDSDEPGA